MIVKRKTAGSVYNNSINDLIDKDERFDELPPEFIQQLGEIDNYDREVEIYKYNDGRADF